MMKARFLLLSMGLVFFAVCCNRNDHFEKTVMKRDDVTRDAETLFPTNGQIANCLMSEYGSSNEPLLLRAELPSSSVSYSLYPGERSVVPASNVSGSMGNIPAGATRIAFHVELPRTIEWALPEEVLEVQAIRLMVGALFGGIALGEDFPYTEAYLEQATVTMPGWFRQTAYSEEKTIDLVDRNGYRIIEPGVEIFFAELFDGTYTLKEGEGVHEPGHRLVVDSTISIDGILSVDEKNRKNPQDGSSPWSLSFTNPYFDFSCYFTGFTGRVDLSRELNDLSMTFSSIPSFMREKVTVFDLDDVHAELLAFNNYPTPLSISGIIQGDEREYPFSSSTFFREDHDIPFHLLLSEKGKRVKDGMSYCQEVTIPGLSGLIDGDPVSFGVKNLRMATDPDTPHEYRFLEGTFSVKPVIRAPLRIGKDFQIRDFVDPLLRFTKHVVKISGTYTVENSFPFDFEIRPILYIADEVIPNSIEPIRIAAGSRESPNVQTVTFDWPINATVTKVILELTGHTGTGRQGEDIYKDQHIAIKDITYEALFDTDK